MKVIPVVPRGYCKGVVRAIALALQTRQQYPDENITICGMIVHNQYVVNALEKAGIKTVDEPGLTRCELIDQIPSGIMLITAHGISEQARRKALDKGLKVIDATCEDVIRTHDMIKKALKEHKEVLYIGKSGHPEAEGTLAIDEKHIHLITGEDDLDALDKDLPYVITNQTTMSMLDISRLFTKAQRLLKNLEVLPETCQATYARQTALMNLAEEIDLVIIVGDPRSNNTTRLADIARKQKRTVMIASVANLDREVLEGVNCVAVSAGASTPTYLTNQVIDYLKNYDERKEPPAVDESKILSAI